jgi:hypothetical protein
LRKSPRDDPAFGSLYCFGSGFGCIGGTASSKPLRPLYKRIALFARAAYGMKKL